MLAHEIKGSGTPLVLVHAFPLSRKMWHATSEILKSKFRVILPDLPGFGGSPRQTKPSIPDIAGNLAALLDQLKITEPVWMGGLSMGGYVAFEFMRQFPKRVKGLGLFATRATPDSTEARENRFRSVEALEKFGMEPFAKKIVKSQLGKTTQEKNAHLISEVTSMMTANKPEGAIDALKAMADRRDSSDLLASIKVPTLVVAGAEDTIASAAEMQAMHQKIAGSQFHSVPECGHLINLEQAETFHKIFQEFLK